MLSPLHLAASQYTKQEPGVITVLLSKGAAVGAVDEEGNTPLHYLCLRMKQPSIIEALIDNGAEVQASNQHNITPLAFAIATGCPMTIFILRAEGATLNQQTSVDKETVSDHALMLRLKLL
eukprot:GILJ01031267.1.p1 GENE.GILJ01031267.1~~GILJ01031267.1.p1  ORF type:complete len:121 (-),score=17.66 GILJ01031267.1:33-395(-)